SIFVHIGVSHVLLNCIAIWVIGRIAETIFGRTRTLAAFFVGGLVGAGASYWTMSAGIAAGASGAALGMLGAVVAELVWHRRRYPDAWRRGISGVLVVIALAQFAADFALQGGVHWAHLTGWLAGVAVGAAWTPHGRAQALRTWTARGVVGLAAVVLSWALVELGRHSLGELYAARPTQPVVLGALTVTVPRAVQVLPTSVADREFDIALHLTQARATAPALALAQWIAHEEQLAQDQQLVLRSVPQRLALAPPWLWSEFVAMDATGRATGRRLIVFAQPLNASDAAVGSVYVSDWLAATAPEVLLRWLRSITLTSTSHPTFD
ncbi:MAG: rhomboid family intramembrane serine protease, partial [Kofleriaceae bacterium]|nr:rhomboid family intramembrane serine protease [Kofleriaceae bacterium]